MSIGRCIGRRICDCISWRISGGSCIWICRYAYKTHNTGNRHGIGKGSAGYSHGCFLGEVISGIG